MTASRVAPPHTDHAARFVIVTGLAGAGKSAAIHALEDLGYLCVDNLPTVLIPTLADLTLGEGGTDAGKTYLLFGSTVAAGGSFDLGLADAAFVGESPSDRSGYSVSSAGDVDDDGLDELIAVEEPLERRGGARLWIVR